MTEKIYSIGVDVGGSHVACAAVDIEHGELLADTLTRVDVDSMGDAGGILSAWAQALNATIAHIDVSRLAGIGFAMPGPFDYRNGISKMEHKFPDLFDKSIADELQPLLETTGPLQMRFLNDATSFAVGEAWLGKGRGARKVVAVTLGTGFGSAFIDTGVPIVERDDVPPEGCLWHLPYRNGTADDYFTTRWFMRRYEAVSGHRIRGALDVAERARSGDSAADDTFRHYGQCLGEFLAPWLQKFGADLVVLGGNICGAFDLFGPALQSRLAAAGAGTGVEVSSLGENAAMIGAARLLDDPFWKQVSNQLPRI
ncbi:MAG: ROK family protein [Xanthomonadales bacterium]|nr:ROK family protein [Xanthomonadales bacterium]